MQNTSKIIIRAVGGLGNQSFIYAIARPISIKYNVPVCMSSNQFAQFNTQIKV